MKEIMNHLRRNRFLLQLLFTLVAAASLGGISIVLVADAIRSAESVVLGDANKMLSAALRELKHQLQYRVQSDPAWLSRSAESKDATLRRISQAAFRSYPGVEGGFFSSRGEFLGYAYPTHDTGAAKTDVPTAERSVITALATRSLGNDEEIHEVIRGKVDLVALAAVRNADQQAAAWAMKRLPGGAQAHNRTKFVVLGVLIPAALVSIAGTLATGIGLGRGVRQIKDGLSRLEKDFNFRLPVRQDELGTISGSINQMASVRGKLDADLRREDRLRALGRLSATLAHEIRNPLNSIRLTVQLLEHRLGSGRVRKEDLHVIQGEVDRLSTLLTDLLDLQRSGQPVFEVQRVLPVVEHCLALLQRQAEMRRIRLDVDIPDPNASACFDSQQLTQAVMNLLLNALEASPEGTAVAVRISEHTGAVTVEVQDSGPGLGSTSANIFSSRSIQRSLPERASDWPCRVN